MKFLQFYLNFRFVSYFGFPNKTALVFMLHMLVLSLIFILVQSFTMLSRNVLDF